MNYMYFMNVYEKNVIINKLGMVKICVKYKCFNINYFYLIV